MKKILIKKATLGLTLFGLTAMNGLELTKKKLVDNIKENDSEISQNELDVEIMKLDNDFEVNIQDLEEARNKSKLISLSKRNLVPTDKEGNVIPSDLQLSPDYKIIYNGVDVERAAYYKAINKMIDDKELFIDDNFNIISIDEIKERCWFWCSKPKRNKSGFLITWYGYTWNFASGEAPSIFNQLGNLLTWNSLGSSVALIGAKYASIIVAYKVIGVALVATLPYIGALIAIDHFNGSDVGTKLIATRLNLLMPVPFTQ